MSTTQTARERFLSQIVATRPQEVDLQPIWSSKARDQVKTQTRAQVKVQTNAPAPPTAAVGEDCPDVLSPNANRLLYDVALNMACWATQRYQKVGLSLSEGKEALEELQARGLVCLHRIPRKGSGGQYIAIEALETAKAYLQEKGVQPQVVPLRGGFVHGLYAVYLECWAKKKTWRVAYQRQFGQKIFDVVFELPDGTLIGVEIILSGEVGWNVSQLEKAASVQGVHEIYAVLDKKAELENIRKRFEKSELNSMIKEKVRFYLACEFFE